MNKIQTTLASTALAVGAVFGSNAIAQNAGVSPERTQITQEIIDCMENGVETDIDNAFASAAANNNIADVHKYVRANTMNTFVDCTAPHVGLEITEDLRADENSDIYDLLTLFGLGMDIVEKQGDSQAFTNHMDEVTTPKVEEYIAQKYEEYGI